jgi:hypothetical protein
MKTITNSAAVNRELNAIFSKTSKGQKKDNSVKCVLMIFGIITVIAVIICSLGQGF